MPLHNVNIPSLAGQKAFHHTVATGTATALADNPCRSIILKSSIDNEDNIAVGVSGVTVATGDEMYPGDTRVLNHNNTNLLYAISPTAAQVLIVTFQE